MSKKQTTFFEDLFTIENENILKTKKRYRKEIRNYTKCFDLLSDLISHICSQSNDKNLTHGARDFVFITFCGRIGLTSKVYLDLAMKGYYYDAEIILRSLYDNLWLLFFLASQDEKTAGETAKKWLKRKLDMRAIKKAVGVFHIRN